MISLTGLQWTKRICIILLSAALCVNGSAPKFKNEKEVAEAYQKILDKHFKLGLEPSPTPSTEAPQKIVDKDLQPDIKPSPLLPFKPLTYVKTLLDDYGFLKLAMNLDIGRHVAKTLSAENSTKPLSKTDKSYSYTKVVPSTTPEYSKDKHPSEASTKTVCTTSTKSSTTDAYPKSTSTTAAYSEDQHSKTKCTDDVSSSPTPPSSKTSQPPTLVGSISGVPGVHFPDYTDIPITSFTCSDKAYLPGFYADLETGCQVFHVCWQSRRESFLCPLGTTFNQALLACDYWYSTNCSLATHYYNVNAESSDNVQPLKSPSSMIDVLLEKSDSLVESSHKSTRPPDAVLTAVSKFLPVKAKVVIYPGTDDKPAKIVASASVGFDSVVHKPYRKTDEEKPLKLQPKEKEEKIASSSASTEDVAPKTHLKKVETKPVKFESFQLNETSNPDVLKVLRLQNEGIVAARVFLLDRLFKKLEFAVAKNGSIVLDKSHEAFKLPNLTRRMDLPDYDFHFFEPAVEKFSSRMLEGWNLLKKMVNYMIYDPNNIENFNLLKELVNNTMHDPISNYKSKFEHVKEPSSRKPEQVTVPSTRKPEHVKEPSSIVKPEPSSTRHPQPVKVEQPNKIREPRVLTQLNPRFIVKPVPLPKESRDDVKVKTQTGKDSKKRAVHVKHSVVSTPYVGKSISPVTKKALAENYLRLMKLRKLA